MQRVLLVENDSIDALFLNRLLCSYSPSLAVQHIATVDEFFSAIQSGSVSAEIIVIDLKLFGIQYEEALSRIRLEPTLQSIPIIALGDISNVDASKLIRNTGVQSLLLKKIHNLDFQINFKSLLMSWLEISKNSSSRNELSGWMPKSVLFLNSEFNEARYAATDLYRKSAGKVRFEFEKSLKNGISKQQREKFDVAVVSLILDDACGITIIQDFVTSSHLPFVVLASSENSNLALDAIRLGAQDFLLNESLDAYRLHQSLSFAITRQEAARISFLKRKEQSYNLKDAVVKVDSFNQSVIVETSQTASNPRLAPLEFKFISFLLQNCGEVVSRDRLLEELWPNQKKPDRRIIDAIISSIKKKSSLFASKIETVYGTGYRLRS